MNTPLAPQSHPWNQEKADIFVRDRRRLPHAMLFAGPRGMGKNALAFWLAKLMLCTDPSDKGATCGLCQGCRLFAAGSHPDLHVVQPEAIYKTSDSLMAQYAMRYPPADKSKDSKDSSVIRIDQIRSLIGAAQTRPQIGPCTIMLLSPADSMNVNSANSLLKLLEEPPADSYLILVADRPARLPATIRSRCSYVEFRVPPEKSALAWLQAQGLSSTNAELLLNLSAGAPLAALSLSESGYLDQRRVLLDDLEKLANGQSDPLVCATRWKPIGTDRCLLWLQGWLTDLVVTFMQTGTTRLRNPDFDSQLQAFKKRLDLKQLFRFSDGVARDRSLLGGPLDEQLLLEDILIRWTQLCLPER